MITSIKDAVRESIKGLNLILCLKANNEGLEYSRVIYQEIEKDKL